MGILVFDTAGGLCNQFYDVLCGVNFAIQYKLQFTFRYCMTRSINMKQAKKLEMHELFDMKYFKTLPHYVEYETIKSDMHLENTYNIRGRPCHVLLNGNKNIHKQITDIQKKYIVLSFFHTIHKFQNITLMLYKKLLPAPAIMQKYMEIKKLIGLENGKYNYIHYRYEPDFINHFQIKNPLTLCNVLNKAKFEDTTCKTYIACSNTGSQLKGCSQTVLDNILYKPEDCLGELGYEECAFIDFMIGKYSKEVYGNRRSSFSGVLNAMHQTTNYYC